MDSDKHIGPFEREFNAVVVAYLDGRIAFEAAAERLALVLRAEQARPRTTEEITQQRADIERWAKEAPAIIARVFPVAQGRPSADLDKVRALLKAAMFRCPRCGAQLPVPESAGGIQKLQLTCASCGWQSTG